MKTNDFRPKLTSEQIKENLERQFGVTVRLESYSREQLEDLRNKLRTRMFQQENSAGINDLLTNETYQKDKAMLALLNTRIKEMLGEDIKKIKDRIDQLSEAKKGTHPPKTKITGKGTKTAAKDYDGDGKVESPKDEVWGSRAKAAAKSGKPFSEAAKPDFLDLDKDGNKKEPMKSAAKGKKTKTTKEAVHKGTYGSDEHDVPARSIRSTTKMTSTLGGSEDDPSGASTADKNARSYALAAKGRKVIGRAQQGSGHERAAAQGRTEESTATKEGKDEGKPGKGFAAIVKKATPKYGKKTAERIAGAQRQKMKKAGKLEEANAIYRRHVNIVNESLLALLQENEEEKAKSITAAGDIVNDYTSWMQRVGQYQTKSMIELADAIRADFGPNEAETFKQAVGPALEATLDVLMQQRETISNAVAVLAGEAAPTAPTMGAEPAGEPAADMGPPEAEPAAPDEMNAPDMTAAAEPAATGREMRESRVMKKIQESHSIISKLAK